MFAALAETKHGSRFSLAALSPLRFIAFETNQNIQGCLVQLGNGLSNRSPLRTLPAAPLRCDLGFVPNSRGNKAAANLGLFFLQPHRPCGAAPEAAPEPSRLIKPRRTDACWRRLRGEMRCAARAPQQCVYALHRGRNMPGGRREAAAVALHERAVPQALLPAGVELTLIIVNSN